MHPNLESKQVVRPSNLKLKSAIIQPKAPNPEQQRGGAMGFIILIVIIAAMLLLGMYLVKQDRVITAKFEGKRWNIPAKVFSQPLELYQGAPLKSEDLDTWLDMLNYKAGTGYERTGAYSKKSGQYIIHTRGFKYNAGDIDPEQVIKISIQDAKVASIQSTQPSETGIVRIEPVIIGGIYPDNNEDRIVVPIEDIPQPLIDALVATEDRSFYQHKGVSLRGIARAVLANLQGGSMQGGSTITQQLIKNFYLNSDRTLKRKANEAVMAVLLELHYSKNEILQTYLNEINLGQNGNRSINGFGLAAQFYFNRPLKELRIDQQALLVGLAKGPTQYNPRRSKEQALLRRNTVLSNMLVTGKIDQATYDKAIAQPLDVVAKPSAGKSRFPDFLDIVKRELHTTYHADDLKNEGLRIFATLDPIAQTAADAAVDKQLAILRKKSAKTKPLQAALVSANPASGELVAVVGSGSAFTGFNRAVDAKRQVGSILKPFVYMMALESGKYNLASQVSDNPVVITLADGTTWSPQNYDQRDHGYVPLITALANSYNQAVVNTGMEYGVDTFIKQLQRLGINQEIPHYPSLFLGAVELSPMDMLGVYQVVAAGGFRTPIISIRSVVDDRGQILQRAGLDTKRSVPPEVNFLINHALQEVVKTGTAKALNTLGDDLHLAGKTGTTNDYRDAWFAGYSGNNVSVVWVGRDDNQPIGLSGGSGALPVWKDYMGRLRLSPVALAQPDTVEWVWLENGSGKLSHESCDNAVYLPIITKFAPKDASECALAVYQQEQARKQVEWLSNQQEVLRRQRQQREDESRGSESPVQQAPANADTWYNKALELF